MKNRTIVATLLLLLTMGGVNCALADDGFDRATQLFRQKKFEAAAKQFEALLKQQPDNSNAAYYAAICYHSMGNQSQAAAMYKSIIDKFPGSEAAQQAKIALVSLIKNAHGNTPDNELGILTAPSESWIPFVRRGQSLVVNASINRNPVQMIFDTGAAQTSFDLDTLKALGIKAPSGPPDGLAYGFGNGGAIKTWKMLVDLQVGNIKRHNYSIIVLSSSLPLPLLGETFFKDMQYAVDNSANAISFKRRDKDYKAAPTQASTNSNGGRASVTVNSSGQYVYKVPFERKGNEMLVQAEVNGKHLEMIFDTGADVTMIPISALKALGVEIPAQAVSMSGRGAAGTAKSLVFQLNKMKVGPVEKGPVVIAVSNATPAPLLGQTFFKDWYYTINNDLQVIEFIKK